MNKPLTKVMMEMYEKTKVYDFTQSAFIASGIPDRDRLERQIKRLKEIEEKMREEQPDLPIDRKLAKTENLENLSQYFQNLQIPPLAANENRLDIVVDALLRPHYYRHRRGNTLTLVTLFNILATQVSVQNLGAYNCEEYYFSRLQQDGCTQELSYPVRRLAVTEHQQKMTKKQRVSNAGLVASLARKTAERYESIMKGKEGRRPVGYMPVEARKSRDLHAVQEMKEAEFVVRRYREFAAFFDEINRKELEQG